MPAMTVGTKGVATESYKPGKHKAHKAHKIHKAHKTHKMHKAHTHQPAKH